MSKKSYLEIVSTVASQLATWIPLVFLALNIHSSTADTKRFIELLSLSLGGVLWFFYQYRVATKMADEQGRLPRPVLFWSLMTGKITSAVTDLGANRLLLVIAPHDATNHVEELLPENVRKAQGAAILFFTISEFAADSAKRSKEVDSLREQLKAQNPVAIILIDNGEWSSLAEYDAVIRAWGATHSELPIVAVHMHGASGPGKSPSLGFSGVPHNSLAKPALLGLTNRLLQQTAIRGGLWKSTAEKLRYIALGASAGALVSTAAVIGFVLFARNTQMRDEMALRSSDQFRESLMFSETSQSSFLNSAYAYRNRVYSDSATRVRTEQFAQNLLEKSAEALLDALKRAHGTQPTGTNVVLLGLVKNGPTYKVIEIARNPSSDREHPPFDYDPTHELYSGISACAVATQSAVYWAGSSTSDPPRTDTMASWNLSGRPVGEYSRALHKIHNRKATCEYYAFPDSVPDDERRELLCVPVGSNTSVALTPLGSLCVSSNDDRRWLNRPWVQSALTTAAVWMSPIDWNSAASKRFREYSERSKDR